MQHKERQGVCSLTFWTHFLESMLETGDGEDLDVPGLYSGNKCLFIIAKVKQIKMQMNKQAKMTQVYSIKRQHILVL